MPERILSLADEITERVSDRVRASQRVAMTTQLLALNAGVAGEVRTVSNPITQTVTERQTQLEPRTAELSRLGGTLVNRLRGTRLTDLALNI